MKAAAAKMTWELTLATDRRVSHLACRIAIILRHRMGADTGEAWVSIAALADMCGASKRAVQGAIRTLVAAGFLIVRRPHRLKVNHYVPALDNVPLRRSPLHLDDAQPAAPHEAQNEPDEAQPDAPPRRSPLHPDFPTSSRSDWNADASARAGECARAPASREGPPPPPAWRAGDRIDHPKHGAGTVTAVDADPRYRENPRLDVAFDDGAHRGVLSHFVSKLDEAAS